MIEIILKVFPIAISIGALTVSGLAYRNSLTHGKKTHKLQLLRDQLAHLSKTREDSRRSMAVLLTFQERLFHINHLLERVQVGRASRDDVHNYLADITLDGLEPTLLLEYQAKKLLLAESGDRQHIPVIQRSLNDDLEKESLKLGNLDADIDLLNHTIQSVTHS